MEETSEREPLIIKAGDLEAAIIDNSPYKEHRFGYNGIASLKHTACPDSPFVPAYSGVNLEFLFDGTRHNMDPRWTEDENQNRTPTPSEVKYSGVNRATVHIPATADWKAEAWVAYQVVEPHYIDVTVRLQAKETNFSHGYLGAFLASYIPSPEKREIQFWGRASGRGEVGWIESALPGDQNRTSYRFSNESRDLLKDEFFFGGTSDAVFEKPVMFGLYKNMALAWFFDAGHGLRMAYCRDGGGETNPAWDFAFLIPDYKPRRIYTRYARLLYKPFVSPEEIMAEYEQWASSRSNG